MVQDNLINKFEDSKIPLLEWKQKKENQKRGKNRLKKDDFDFEHERDWHFRSPNRLIARL